MAPEMSLEFTRIFFGTFEGVTVMSIIITVYQTARRQMPEGRNFVHFYLVHVFV
jgi:hypothetical protein